MKSLGKIAKRTLDLLTAVFGLFFSMPFFLIIAYIIRHDSPGPVFHKCLRMGKDEKPFHMWKFRTMYETPENHHGPRITCEEDERITPFGRWLRDTKINELPQLINVLKGDMSLVGPRPEDVEIAKTWEADVSAELLSVLPGVTSPASILYRDEEKLLSPSSLMDDYLLKILPDKIRLDQLYVRNQSFWSDLDIIFWTMVIFIPRMVNIKIPEGHLFSGPISRLVNRYVSWFLIDFLISIIVIGAAGLIWRTQGPLNWGAGSLVILSAALAFTFSGINAVFGLNRVIWSKATVNNAIVLSVSCWLVTILFLLMNYIFPYLPGLQLTILPPSMILAIGFFAQIGFMLARYRWRLVTSFANRWLSWRRSPAGVGEKVLIVGTGEGFSAVNRMLRQGEFKYVFSIVGAVDDVNVSMHGMQIEGCTILGKTSDLPAIVEKEGVGLIAFTSANIPSGVQRYVRSQWKKSKIKLLYLDDLPGLFNEKLAHSMNHTENHIWPQDMPKYQAIYDLATGLPNRFLFQDRLLQSHAFARRYDTRPLAIFVRLESVDGWEGGMKTEHWAQVRLAIYRKLLRIKRESDTLAVLGEKEFAYIFENVQNDSAIPSIKKRIANVLANPFEINGQRMVLHSSVRVCTDFDFLFGENKQEMDAERIDAIEKLEIVSTV